MITGSPYSPYSIYIRGTITLKPKPSILNPKWFRVDYNGIPI